ncbi:phage head-tail joining protein [Roseomonas rosulenta]|uniref:phage head-tail joining protein n=1 Tax=Roseomonas rosulenta TaxID=2748667 RepID=UPI0018DFF993|nr:hypothetical protein [Roseomonas rosulenta]
MASPAQLRAWRSALWAARMRGVREVRDQNGESVTFKSDSEMAAAIGAADAEIAALERPRFSTVRFITSKGV